VARPMLIRCKSRLFLLASLLLVFLAPLSTSAYAGAQIAISPTRLVFEGRTRSASITLINRGNESSTFRVSFEHKRMTEDGQFETIKQPKPGEVFSDQMIRFSPRQVVLPPGKAQVVRLLLRKPPNLPDGEYRSHMLFSEIPEQTNKTIQSQATKSNQLSISIKPVLGISIPVIVRQGKTSAEVNIASASLELAADKSKGFVTMMLDRSGNQSVYGDFVATYHSNGDKTGIIVSQMNGVAVYTPNKKRIVKLAVQAPAGTRLVGGTIEISFRTPPTAGNKILAQGQVTVPSGN